MQDQRSKQEKFREIWEGGRGGFLQKSSAQQGQRALGAFKKHKGAMWYFGMIEGGHFGEDYTINYKSKKGHFVLYWVVVYQAS